MDFCLKYPDIVPENIIFQNDILSHPENWITRRLAIFNRRVILDSFSNVISKVLGVLPKIITESDAHDYLYNMSKNVSLGKKADFYQLSPTDIHAKYMLNRVSLSRMHYYYFISIQ